MIRDRHRSYVRVSLVLGLVALGTGCYTYRPSEGRPSLGAEVRADLRPRSGTQNSGRIRVKGTLIADTGDSLLVEVPPPPGTPKFAPGAGRDTVALTWDRVDQLRVHRLDVLRTVGLAAVGVGGTAAVVFGAVDRSSAGAPPQGEDGEPLSTIVGWRISVP